MEFDSRDLALAAVFTALYVTINFVQMVSVGNPTVFGPVQLRIADCLIALTALLGFPAIGGVTVGCFLTNAYYFIGFADIVFGPIANLVAAITVLMFRKHRLVACVMGALPIGIIVGSYLWIFFRPPEVLSILPPWAAMIVSLTISSLIAVAVIGYLLLSILGRPSILKPLKSRGLKVAAEDK